MTRLRLVLATIVLAAGAGCAHPQPVTQVARPTPPAAARVVVARPPAIAPVAEAAPLPARPENAFYFDFDSA
jgi:hypothetical protein